MYLILLKNLWRIKLKKMNILCVCNEVGYRNGHGRESNQMMADVWLYIAARSGSEEARDELVRNISSVDEVHYVKS